jgi:hypothetical protein
VTVPVQTPISTHIASGASGVFAFDYLILSADDIAVYADDVEVDVANFVVAGVGDENGGTVTITPIPAAGVVIVLQRETELRRDTDYQTLGDFRAIVVNPDFDRLWLALQELLSGNQTIRNVLRVPSRESIPQLPAAADRGNTLLGFDASGDPVVTTPNPTDASAVALALATFIALIASDAGAGNVGYDPADTYPIRTLGAHAKAYVSVLDYMTQAELTDWLTGAPVLDHTAAINRATLATQLFTTNDNAPKRRILMPGGNWNVAGPVYVRKGQELTGDGSGATRIIQSPAAVTSIFRMGYGLIGGTPTMDPGGLPPVICNLHIHSSSATNPAIDTGSASGWLLHSLFLTNCGQAILASGSDGTIDRCFVDQGLTGIVTSNMQNLIVSNCLFFLGNYLISIGTGSHDVQISNCHFEYNQFASILFQDGATGIAGISVSNCQFLLNQQHASFVGFVHIRSGDVQATFTNCEFRNMKGYAVTHGTGVGGKFNFNGCLFDGLKTTSGYTQSTTAGGISMANETMRLADCEFRNLNVAPVVMGGTFASVLEIRGASYTLNAGASFVSITNTSASSRFTAQGVKGDAVMTLVNTQSPVPVKLKGNIDWLGANVTGSSRIGVKVPYQFANQWIVTVRANAAPGGSLGYRKTSSFAVQKENGFSGSARQTLTKATLLQTAADGAVAAIDIQLDFGAIGGGATLAGNFASGDAYFTVPDTYANVEFDVEPIV